MCYQPPGTDICITFRLYLCGDASGYRLWDPINRKIVRSQDVVFFEDETIEDIVKPKKQISAPQVIDMDPVPSPIF